MNILILGSGGREHALAWAAQAHPAADLVVVAPGNPGVEPLAERADLDILDPGAVAELAAAEAIDLVLIGPEAALAAGVADRLREAGVAVLGPSAEAARIETSKAFAKEVCDAAGIPTAAMGAVRGRRGRLRPHPARGRADRRQGRRARRRQGGGRGPRRGDGARRRARDGRARAGRG